MPKIFQNKTFLYCTIFFLLVLLIIVRWQEQNLFYDPFLKYFKSVFQGKPLPNYNFLLLFFNYFVRFFINSSLSILIIYLLFNDIKINKLLVYIYGILFLIIIFIPNINIVQVVKTKSTFCL